MGLVRGSSPPILVPRTLCTLALGLAAVATACSDEDGAALFGPDPLDASSAPSDANDASPGGEGTTGPPDMGPDPIREPAPAAPLWVPDETTGSQRAAALLVRNDRSPIPCEGVELELFFESVEDWFEEVSYGELRLNFDPVVGWLDVEVPEGQTTNFTPILQAAAADAGVDFRGTTRVFAGYTRGAGGESPSGRQRLTVLDPEGTYEITASKSFVKGFDCSDSDFSTTVHELGHGLGVGHSSFRSSLDGSITNYGMTNDVMGGGSSRSHYSAAHRDLLGWMRSGRLGLVDGSGIYRLRSLDGASPRALRIPAPGEDGAYYYLEIRGPDGQSDPRHTEQRGVIVTKLVPSEFASDNEPGFRLFGVDTTPETPSRTSEDFALLPGRSWTADEGDLHVTALERSGDDALVRVEFGPGENEPPEVVRLSRSEVPRGSLLRAEVTDPDHDSVEVWWSFIDDSSDPYRDGEDFARGTEVVVNHLSSAPRRIYAVATDGRGGTTWRALDLFDYQNRAPRIRDVRKQREGLRSWAMSPRVSDDDLLWWSWSFGDGSASTLPNPVHAYDAPGRYEVELTVSDGTDSNTTQFVLDATAMDNTAPVANAGPDATTDTGEAMVDGRESFDPDAHPGALRHFWSGPRDVAFGDSRSPRTTVASERTGTFTLTLEVFDGELSDEDSVDVTFE